MTTTIKCVLVGDETVGKTDLLKSSDCHRDGLLVTFNAYETSVTVQGRAHTLLLFDTTGQEHYDKIRCDIYDLAHVFLVCFSVVSPASLKNAVEMWVPEVRRCRPGVPILLVGTETDQRDNPDKVQALAERGDTPVTRERGETTAESLNVARYVECSALTQRGLKELFNETVLTYLSPPKTYPSSLKHTLREIMTNVRLSVYEIFQRLLQE